MRTTIDIPDSLYHAVRTRTAAEGTTMRYITVALLGDWLERADWHPRVRTVLVDAPHATPARRSRIPFLGAGRSGADLDVPHDMASVRKSIAEGRKTRGDEL